MKNCSIHKKISNSNMESDHIVFKDSNGNTFDFFWFSHEAIIKANGKNNFVFLKRDNEKIFKFFSNLAHDIKSFNKENDQSFVSDSKFTWHHMSRAWDIPFEDEAGFCATINTDKVEIHFFPSKTPSYYEKEEEYFISMGGIDGYIEPYQSISDLFAFTLNYLISYVPYRENNEKTM